MEEDNFYEQFWSDKLPRLTSGGVRVNGSAAATRTHHEPAHNNMGDYG